MFIVWIRDNLFEQEPPTNSQEMLHCNKSLSDLKYVQIQAKYLIL